MAATSATTETAHPTGSAFAIPSMAVSSASQPDPDADADDPVTMRDCMICCEHVAEKSIIYPCPRYPTHSWCQNCLEDSFLNALFEKRPFSPPTCCGLLQIHNILDRLSPKVAGEYRNHFKEWLTRDRKYCPVPTCSAFLDPDQLHSVKLSVDASFQCPTCTADICAKCDQLGHRGNCDLSTKAEEAALLARFKIKQCPRCHRSIKKMHGCPHMACICGAHFCWHCNKSTDQCYGDCRSDRSNNDDESDECEEGDEDAADESVEDDGIETTIGKVSADESMKTNPEKDDAVGVAQDVNASLSAQMLPLPAASGLAPLGPFNFQDLMGHGLPFSDTVRQANDAIRETILGPNLPTPLPPLSMFPNSRPTIPRPANLRPANTSPVDLDAGGEARWANAEEDFGEEPGDEPSGQVWSCHHLFRTYYYPPKDVPHRGNLHLMECNRCFSRVVPTPLDPANGTPEAKRRKTSSSIKNSTATSEVDKRGSNEALECFKCCLVVCKACKEKFEHEEEEEEEDDDDEE